MKPSDRKSKARKPPGEVPTSTMPWAEVSADGRVIESCQDVRSSRISKGVYNLEFAVPQVVRSVCVQVRRKPHSYRVMARIMPLKPIQAAYGDLRSVEIALVNSRMSPVDRPFFVAAGPLQLIHLLDLQPIMARLKTSLFPKTGSPSIRRKGQKRK